jgi:hypothetical protein
MMMNFGKRNWEWEGKERENAGGSLFSSFLLDHGMWND